MAFRRFEYHSGGSNKFWEIETVGPTYKARWGKVGNKGQTQKKVFRSGYLARDEARKKISEKLGKGYHEIDESIARPTKKAPVKPKVVKPVNELDEEDLILD